MKNNLNMIEAISLITLIMITQIILNFPEYLIDITGSGTTINLIFISIISILFCLIITKIFKSFSNADIIDISEFIGGKFLKFIVSIIFILFILLSVIITISNFLYLLRSVYFPSLNILFILAFFIIPTILANQKGFYVIKKISLIFIPILIISIFAILITTIDNFNINDFFPIFGYNIKTTFGNGLQNIFIFNFILLYLFIMPFLDKKNNYKKIVVTSFFINILLLLISIVSIITYFPNLITNSVNKLNHLNSAFSLTRTVNISTLIAQSDALFILIWSFAILCYISFSTYAITYILNKLFNYESKEQTIYPIISIIIGFCVLTSKISITTFLEKYIFKYSSILLTFGISFIILLLGYFKKTKRKDKITKNVKN